MNRLAGKVSLQQTRTKTNPDCECLSDKSSANIERVVSCFAQIENDTRYLQPLNPHLMCTRFLYALKNVELLKIFHYFCT